jgi:Uma2 family endonuclease
MLSFAFADTLAMSTEVDTLVDQLYHVAGKAEIVGDSIIMMSPASDQHGYASLEIAVSLRQYTRKKRAGRAVGDNIGFLCNLPHRKSFSPDAAYYTGPRGGRKFFPQAPDFAVEVRSDDDYGPLAERDLAAKRADYFAAGTQVVWDVDLDSDEVVRVYRASQPTTPTVYRRGDKAEAEPAVPGWSMPVNDLFDE